MAYLGTQPNDVKKNIGLYTPSEILQLTKEGSWGGSLELIEEQTYSSAVSFVDFTNINESTYDIHFVTTNNLKPTTDTNFNLNFYESGVLETASVYQWARQYNQNNGGNGTQNSTAVAGIQLCNTLGSATNETGQGYVYIYNAGNSSKYTFCNFQDVVLDNNGIFTQTFGGGVYPTAEVNNAFQIEASAGNITDATMKLYGVKQL